MELNYTIKYLETLVESYEDYPRKGVSFKDLSLIYTDHMAVMMVLNFLKEKFKENKIEADCIIGCDARGFIIGSLLANELKLPFIMARKPGKLPPCELLKESYELEYGKSELQMVKHIISKYKSPIIADDVLATGGTCCAVTKMLSKIGINVSAYAFISDIAFLKGKELSLIHI